MISSPRALVTGLTGQDGSFLAELLLDQGYKVIGTRRAGESSLGCAAHLADRVELIEAELLLPETLAAAVTATRPDEIYHLAAPTFVPDSWRSPSETFAAIVGATAVLLETVRDATPSTRVFIASSAEIFGDAGESPQNEETVCRPRHPYGAAKLAAHLLAGQFRAHEGLFACSGILYNHESERRPGQFVTRKITKAVAAIKWGRQHELILGDLSTIRDWCFAGDVMRGAWLALQHDRADDYILCSGEAHTVRDWLEGAFRVVALDPEDWIRIDPQLVRGKESTPSVGDPSRARRQLRWTRELDFEALIERMVAADLADQTDI